MEDFLEQLTFCVTHSSNGNVPPCTSGPFTSIGYGNCVDRKPWRTGLMQWSKGSYSTSAMGHLFLHRDSKSSITYISMCIQMPQVCKVYVYEYVCVKQYCIYITTFMILPLLLAWFSNPMVKSNFQLIDGCRLEPASGPGLRNDSWGKSWGLLGFNGMAEWMSIEGEWIYRETLGSKGRIPNCWWQKSYTKLVCTEGGK